MRKKIDNGMMKSRDEDNGMEDDRRMIKILEIG